MALTLTRLRLVAATFLLAMPLIVQAQQAEKVYRIGYMSIPSSQSADLTERVFLPALRERGLVEGKNLIIEWRWADGKSERLPGFAAELVALNVDLIVAPQSDSALAAKRATRTIPIVHILAGDPVADGLVASLAHPGGNVTGLSGAAEPRNLRQEPGVAERSHRCVAGRRPVESRSGFPVHRGRHAAVESRGPDSGDTVASSRGAGSGPVRSRFRRDGTREGNPALHGP